MFETPDPATLRLCSMLASGTFAAVFLWFWRGRRDALYLAHWAFSLLLYIATILVFQIVGGPPGPVFGVLLFAALAGANMLVVSGVALFEGRRSFAPWMVVPMVASASAFVVGGQDAAAGALALGMGMFGVALLSGGDAHWRRGRRIAGLALLGYVPGYAAAAIGDMTQLPGFDQLASIALLSDQVLLPMLYLGLLAMPGERAVARVREQALRDPLTGVRNRGWLIEQETRLAVVGTAIVLIDVDHFKEINDRLGHAAGDAVLIALAAWARVLANAAQGTVVRLGGDEFAVILRDTTPTAARRLAERLGDATDDSDTPWTVSVGVAMVLAREPSLSAAMARADRSMYLAKAGGRARVAA